MPFRESAPQDRPDDFMLSAADISTSSKRIEAENQCIPDVIPNTGVFDVHLLPSFAALLFSGAGTVLLILMVIKNKRRYGAQS